MLRATNKQRNFPKLDQQIEGRGPRKRLKLELVQRADEYNEFYGEIEQKDQCGDIPQQQYRRQNITNIEKQKQKYGQILSCIKTNPKQFKRLNKFEEKLSKEVKIQQGHLKKQENINNLNQKDNKDNQNCKKQSNSIKQTPSNSNWANFLKNTQNIKSKKIDYDFVAIDCQFVKAEDKDCLARISIVNQHNDILLDAYTRPRQKITDYLTHISGITFSHIKNAQNSSQVLKQAKKLMLNKIVIGHTLFKDLQVCGLTNWKGFKGKVDIAESSIYMLGKKKISLKNLSYSKIGETIQQGSHSSVEDAQATMKLFLKSKIQILKENKLIKK